MEKTSGKGVDFIQSIMLGSFMGAWIHCNNIMKHQKSGKKLSNGTRRRAIYLSLVCSSCSLFPISSEHRKQTSWGSPYAARQIGERSHYQVPIPFLSSFLPEVIYRLLAIQQWRKFCPSSPLLQCGLMAASTSSSPLIFAIFYSSVLGKKSICNFNQPKLTSRFVSLP